MIMTSGDVDKTEKIGKNGHVKWGDAYTTDNDTYFGSYLHEKNKNNNELSHGEFLSVILGAFSASRKPPHAGSRLRWMDNAASMPIIVVRLLNGGDKQEVDTKGWIMFDEKKALK